MTHKPRPDHAAPSVLSMEVDVENEDESEYRLLVGNRVKYLTIAPGTFENDILSFPLGSLPPLPYQDDSWNHACISRDPVSGGLSCSRSSRQLAAVQNVWHKCRIDVLHLKKTIQLTGAAFEAILAKSPTPASSTSLVSHGSPSSYSELTVVAKIARFDWEIPRIEQETRAYQVLQHQHRTQLAPQFLGHLHENGRVMGFLLEKVPDRRYASIGDLKVCETALASFHELGMLHGDVNRHNFLVGEDGAMLIDFERCHENASAELRRKEMDSLEAELTEESGRGAGFMSGDAADWGS